MKTVNSVAEIIALLPISKEDRRELILIGGCSRSGKSSLAESLKLALITSGLQAHALSLDSWIISLEDRPIRSRVIDRFDGESAVKAVKALLVGEAVSIPKYDAKSRRRIQGGERQFKLEAGVLILEGVVALAFAELRQAARLSIFVEIDDQIRFKRFCEFYENEKGLSYVETVKLFEAREGEEAPFIKDTRQYAQMVYLKPL